MSDYLFISSIQGAWSTGFRSRIERLNHNEKEALKGLCELVDQKKKDLKLFALAARDNLAELKKELGKDGVRINATDRDGLTLLMRASSKNRLKAVNLLLQNGADTTATFTLRSTNFTATKLAAWRGHSKVLAALLDHTYGQHDLGNDPMAVEAFVQAARQGRRDCVELLFRRKVNINACNGLKCTALTGAASMGQTEIVKLLLAMGVDLNHRDQGGRSALGSALFAGHQDTALFLIENGAVFEGEANEGGESRLKKIKFAK